MAARRKTNTKKPRTKKRIVGPARQGEKLGGSSSPTTSAVIETAPEVVDPAVVDGDVIAAPRFVPDPDDSRFVFMTKSGKRLTRAFAERIYQPGASGNPLGRPKRRKLADVFTEVLARKLTPAQRRRLESRLGFRIEDLSDGDPTRMEAMCQVFVEKALSGSFEAFREIGDRVDPKPRRVEITGREGAPVTTAVIARGMTNEEAADVYRRMIEGVPEEPNLEGHK